MELCKSKKNVSLDCEMSKKRKVDQIEQEDDREPKKNEEESQISQQEAEIYDRQIRLWGAETQRR